MRAVANARADDVLERAGRLRREREPLELIVAHRGVAVRAKVRVGDDAVRRRERTPDRRRQFADVASLDEYHCVWPGVECVRSLRSVVFKKAKISETKKRLAFGWLRVCWLFIVVSYSCNAVVEAIEVRNEPHDGSRCVVHVENWRVSVEADLAITCCQTRECAVIACLKTTNNNHTA